MSFGGKNSVGSEKCFSPSDLYQYAETLIREARLQERRSIEKTNYSWLKSKQCHDFSVETDLEKLRPIICKMSSESCTVIAVKLDNLTEDYNTTTNDIIITFKKLIEEQDSILMMTANVKSAKETNVRKNKVNKVHPELLPPGRQPTVSFIVNSENVIIE